MSNFQARAIASKKLEKLKEMLGECAQLSRDIQLKLLNERSELIELSGDEFVLFSDVECGESAIVDAQRWIDKSLTDINPMLDK